MNDELFTLQEAARPLGLYVGVHQHYDPCLGGGQYFIMPKKKHPDERCPTLLKYATAEQVEEFIAEQIENYAN